MNAESTGEFVVNMVSESLKEQMNVTTTMVEFGIDELKMAGLTPAPSTLVKPPRVKESPVALECKYWRTIELPGEKGHETKRGSVVFGQVVGVHIDDSIIKDGRILRQGTPAEIAADPTVREVYLGENFQLH